MWPRPLLRVTTNAFVLTLEIFVLVGFKLHLGQTKENHCTGRRIVNKMSHCSGGCSTYAYMQLRINAFIVASRAYRSFCLEMPEDFYGLIVDRFHHRLETAKFARQSAQTSLDQV